MCWSVCFGLCMGYADGDDCEAMYGCMCLLVCSWIRSIFTVISAMLFINVISCVLSKTYAHSHCCAAIHVHLCMQEQCAFAHARTRCVVNSVWWGNVCMCSVYARGICSLMITARPRMFAVVSVFVCAAISNLLSEWIKFSCWNTKMPALMIWCLTSFIFNAATQPAGTTPGKQTTWLCICATFD